MLLALQTPIVDPGRDLLGIGADVALVLLGVFAIVGSIFALVLLRRIVVASRELRAVAKSVRGSTGPILEHGKGVAANVEFITAALRTDVEKLNDSVRALSGRLQQASDRMEERIEEFNALMEVVQGEAEGVFLDTAATVRGVRAGASALAGGRPTEEEDRAEPPTDRALSGSSTGANDARAGGVSAADSQSGGARKRPDGRPGDAPPAEDDAPPVQAAEARAGSDPSS